MAGERLLERIAGDRSRNAWLASACWNAWLASACGTPLASALERVVASAWQPRRLLATLTQ
jgi:hypothetical protein